MADFDGDGDMDVASATRVGSAIAWYENLGVSAGFGVARQIDRQLGVIGTGTLVAADLDGDADVDLVYLGGRVFSSGEQSAIVWYENIDGRGGFGQHKLISSVDSWPDSLLVDDFDGDGDMDVASSLAGEQVAWFENVGGVGSFATKHLVASDLPMYRAIGSDDLDQDGDRDLLSVSMRNGELIWFPNLDGKGMFGESQVIADGNAAVYSVATEDIDGDGDRDVVFGGDSIGWYENLGPGQFQLNSIIDDASGDGGTLNVRSLATGDVDGDGDIDLLVALFDQGRFAWYENTDARGSFRTERFVVGDGAGALAISATDLDQDGDLDALATSFEGHQIAWHDNIDGSGTFRKRVVTPDVLASTAPVTGDFDSDGDLDVVGVTGFAEVPYRLVWYENIDGTGTFGNASVIEDDLADFGAILVGDVDGDLDDDVIHFSRGKTNLYVNSGLGKGFAEPSLILSGDVVPVDLVDMDGDTDVDLVTSDNNRAAWYENINGSGTFGNPREIAPNGRRLAVADVDLDGDPDLILRSRDGRTITWHENADGKGDAWMERAVAVDFDATVTSLLAADLDSDGDVDLVVASASHNLIVWYENRDGRGAFGPAVVITESDVPIALASVDLDRDGYLDLVGADDELFWYENLHGRGVFGPPQRVAFAPTARGGNSVEIADFDQDQNPDILFASFAELSWFETRLIADVNDDGRFDSSDLVMIFQAGEYEDRIARNSTFQEGDWNGDAEFNSSDLVIAFQAGHYEREDQEAVALAREREPRIDEPLLNVFEPVRRAFVP